MNNLARVTTIKEAALAEIFGDLLQLIERTESLYERIPIANDEAVRRFDAALVDAARRIEQQVSNHTDVATNAADQSRIAIRELTKMRSEFIACADNAFRDYRDQVTSGAETKWRRRFAAASIVVIVTVMAGAFVAGLVIGTQHKTSIEKFIGKTSLGE